MEKFNKKELDVIDGILYEYYDTLMEEEDERMNEIEMVNIIWDKISKMESALRTKPIGPQLKVHKVAELKDKRQYIHMTLTKIDGTNYNLWVLVNEDGSAYVDVSQPYES